MIKIVLEIPIFKIAKVHQAPNTLFTYASPLSQALFNPFLPYLGAHKDV